MKYLYIFIALLVFSCNDGVMEGPDANTILEKSINTSGASNFYNSTITFNVKELEYELYRKEHISKFTMTRRVDTILYKAVYNMGEFGYYVNGELQNQTSQAKVFFDTKLIGFVYTQSIPFVLDQNAIKVTRLKDAKIDGNTYFTVYASNKDPEMLPQDEFILYINPETYLVEFYTQKYSLFQNRQLFKKAVNPRLVNEVHFVDYQVFYEKKDSQTPLEEFYNLYNDEKLSRQDDIILENINVALNSD